MWELDHKDGWTKELMLLNCGAGEDSCKEIKLVNPKGNQLWIFIGRTDAEAEAPILWPLDVKSWLTGKRPWCWERLKVTGERSSRGWDDWIALLTQWIWVWVSFGRWWRTGRPAIFQSMVSQRVRHDWETEQQQFKKQHLPFVVKLFLLSLLL